VLVDDDDFESLSVFKWFDHKGYASRQFAMDGGKTKMIPIHRLIMKAQKGDIVDHINGNVLDNRKENLRFCTHAQNCANRKLNANSSSGLKGVSFHKEKRLWRAQIRMNGKKKYLGYFQTKELAHEAYCRASDAVFGEFARHQ